jgi:hypothetical protein
MNAYEFVMAQKAMLGSLEYGYRRVLEYTISGLYTQARMWAVYLRDKEIHSDRAPEDYTNWIAVIVNAPDDKLESACLDALVFALSGYLTEKESRDDK